MLDRQLLNGFEELVLMAIARLHDNAYGVTIRQTVEEKAQRPTSIGALYAALDRLEEKGFVESRQGDPTPERGGRAKRYFKITGHGIEALNEMQQARARMLEGVNLGWQPAGGAA